MTDLRNRVRDDNILFHQMRLQYEYEHHIRLLISLRDIGFSLKDVLLCVLNITLGILSFCQFGCDLQWTFVGKLCCCKFKSLY